MQVILDPKTSRRIFELAKDQQDELDMDEGVQEVEDEADDSLSRPRGPITFDEDDDHFDNTGEEIEEEYVSPCPREWI